MREVRIAGGGHQEDKLLRAMGGDINSEVLLCWGKVGRSLQKLVPSGEEDADPENDKDMHVRTHCPTPLSR